MSEKSKLEQMKSEDKLMYAFLFILVCLLFLTGIIRYIIK